jgi:hypothetical protein
MGTSLRFLISALILMAISSQAQILPLGFWAKAPQRLITSSDGNYNFGTVNIGSSVAKTITLRNTGAVKATSVYVALVGTNLALSSNNCGTAGAKISLAANATCTFVVTYTPTAAVSLSGASFQINGSFRGSGLQTSLSGIGNSPLVYATLNPAAKGPNSVLSNGNLTVTNSTQSFNKARANMGKSSGKWYFEAVFGSATSDGVVGLEQSVSGLTNYPGGSGSTGFGWYALNGARFYNPSGTSIVGGSAVQTSTGTCAGAISSSVTMGFAVDLDARTIQFYRNGVLCTGALNVTNFLAGTYYPVGTPFQTSNSVTFNFGPTFPYGVPSGYNAGWYE